MPPIKAERFLLNAYLKQKQSMSFSQWDKFIHDRLFIDVNDPKATYLVQDMKDKNENLIKLMEEDAKNPLADLTPFRHQLMVSRKTNPQLRDAYIPLLESDIVNDAALIAFIEKYCKEVGKRELHHGLNQIQKSMLNERGISDEGIRRHQIVIEEIKKLQKSVHSGAAKPHLNYNSVVQEIQLESKNPFSGLISKIFVTRRKLRPNIKVRQAVPMDNVNFATLKIHIASGINIPIREGSLE